MTTPTQQPNNPAPGSPEYEAKMEQLGAALETPPSDNNTPPASEDRPSWLPEKFKTAEDLAKAYQELEKRQGGKQQQPPADPLKVETPPATPEAQAAEAVENAGLKMDEFTTEFETKGALSEESYAKLEKAGIGRQMVDTYIAGQQAQAAQMTQGVFETVGGQEQYAAMMDWAKSLPPADVAAYNKIVDSGDMGAIKLAAAGLHAKYTAANPAEPRLIQGESGKTNTGAYESRQQMIADMRDPRYKTDPAFRKMVEARLANANIF